VLRFPSLPSVSLDPAPGLPRCVRAREGLRETEGLEGTSTPCLSHLAPEGLVRTSERSDRAYCFATFVGIPPDFR
jgi:hypothetical protein